MSAQIPIETLEALTGRAVARVFDAGVVAWPGAVLVVPLALVGGDLARLVYKCPCGIADVIDAMQKARPIPMAEAEFGLWPGPGSQYDVVKGMVNDLDYAGGWWVAASESMGKRIFTHDCGVRLGLINDMVAKGRQS